MLVDRWLCIRTHTLLKTDAYTDEYSETYLHTNANENFDADFSTNPYTQTYSLTDTVMETPLVAEASCFACIIARGTAFFRHNSQKGDAAIWHTGCDDCGGTGR